MKSRPLPAVPFGISLNQKKRDVHIISARNSGAGNDCADFMGAWHFWLFLLENPHAHKILLLEGGVGFFRRGGGSANFIFMAVGIFPTKLGVLSHHLQCEMKSPHLADFS